MNNQVNGFKPFNELEFKELKTEDYKEKNKIDVFLKRYYVSDPIQDLFDSKPLLIIGDKGSGKSALALYLSSCSTNEDIIRFMFDFKHSDYKKYKMLLKHSNPIITEIKDVWLVILLISITERIIANEKGLVNTLKFRSYNKKVKEYKKTLYKDILDCEHITNFLVSEVSSDASGVDLKLVNPALGGIGIISNSSQMSIMQKGTLEKKISSKVLDMKNTLLEFINKNIFSHSYWIFIDNIDHNADLSINEYEECIKGLFQAQDFIKDELNRKGIYTTSLLKPSMIDILENTRSITHLSSILESKSYLLSWRNSSKQKFLMFVDHFINSQQESDKKSMKCVNHYFSGIDLNIGTMDKISEITLMKPRNLLVFLLNIQKLFPKLVKIDDFRIVLYNQKVRKGYRDYLFKEISEILAFENKEFNNKHYIDFITEFIDHVNAVHNGTFYYNHFELFFKKRASEHKILNLKDQKKMIMQIMYDNNIISYHTSKDYYINEGGKEIPQSNTIITSKGVKYKVTISEVTNSTTYDPHYGYDHTITYLRPPVEIPNKPTNKNIFYKIHTAFRIDQP